jgi:uncharacterized membrane protein YdbT with pleckstrin-like domain
MEKNKTPYSGPIHESVFPLSIKLFILQLLVGLSLVTINIALFGLIEYAGSDTFLIIMLSICQILLQLFNAALVIYIILQWSSTTYVITPNAIEIRRGIAQIVTTKYKIEATDYIEVDQSLLGRLLGYGTIKIHNPSLQNDILIPNIPDPYQYSQVIDKSNKNEG